jgi:superfamily II DNA or RNA helicase
LAATAAFGKTVVAAWLIAKRGVDTLVLVHRRQLLKQWSNGYPHFSDCRHKTSEELAAAEGKHPARLTERSSRVWSAKAS